MDMMLWAMVRVIEDKLVAAPPDKHFSKEDIAGAVRFREQYFHTEIMCAG